MSEQSQWLLRHVPFYSEWYRLWLFWRLCEGALPAAKVDADWQGDPRAVGALNDGMRQLLTTYLEAQFADVPDLLAARRPPIPAAREADAARRRDVGPAPSAATTCTW